MLVQMVGLEPTLIPILNRMRLPIAPHLCMVRPEGVEPSTHGSLNTQLTLFSALAVWSSATFRNVPPETKMKLWSAEKSGRAETMFLYISIALALRTEQYR